MRPLLAMVLVAFMLVEALAPIALVVAVASAYSCIASDPQAIDTPCAQVSEHCGTVYSFPSGVEKCVASDDDLWDAECLYGRPAVESPRLEAVGYVCIWGCGDDPWWHKCDAKDGCFGCRRSER